jgi:hypothetical protein
VPDDGYDSDGMTELVYKPTDLAAPHLSSQSSPAVDSVVNRMAYSVSRGNPRKAWRLMDESPVMDLSDPATAAAVADLHPQDDEPDLDALTDVPGVVPFRTPRPIFDAVIDKLPSDRAAGMGGAPFEELVELVEYGHGDTLYAIVCMLNDGTLHPDAWDVLEPSALIALRKPNGKARPIAMGDVFERVGGRCVLFAKLEGLDEWLTSAADLRRILASDEWRAAFVDVPGLPHIPMPESPPPLPERCPLQLCFTSCRAAPRSAATWRSTSTRRASASTCTTASTPST